ncbi:MAG: YigZ family protein [Tepidanaerobacteraceae bacterium]|jgi:uncharacterized YigZ family protein
MKPNSFLTIKNPMETIYIEKKSKFIANIRSAQNLKEIDEQIEAIRKKYWDAAHNVYAYTLGLNDQIQKFSDDGEPSGTAGRPVLEVLKSRDLKNVLVVVTRYFGGIKLGAGGLVRAYSESVSNCIKKAGVIKKVRCNKYFLMIDYSLLGKTEWELKNHNLLVEDIVYDENVLITVGVPFDFNMDFGSFILNLTSGNAEIKKVGEVYINAH